jgi:hypothetical protein
LIATRRSAEESSSSLDPGRAICSSCARCEGRAAPRFDHAERVIPGLRHGVIQARWAPRHGRCVSRELPCGTST